MLSAFRNEIIEAHKGRAELLKWKLILAATLGAVGLGFRLNVYTTATATAPKPFSFLLLCFIPFVCVYVDSLCQHLYLRVIVISVFFSNYPYKGNEERNPEINWLQDYELFCNETRKSIKPFSLEDWAMGASTSFLSLLVLGLAIWYQSQSCSSSKVCFEHRIVSSFLGAAGVIGFGLSWFLKNQFDAKCQVLSGRAEELIQNIVQAREKSYVSGDSKQK